MLAYFSTSCIMTQRVVPFWRTREHRHNTANPYHESHPLWPNRWRGPCTYDRHLYPHPSTTAGVTVDGCGYKFNEKTYVPKPGFPRDERKHAQYHYALVTLKAVILLLACGADVCRFLTSDRFAFIANHLMQVCVRPWIRT